MSDRWAVALAACTALGAWAARPVPVWVGAALVVVALSRRRPALVCVGAAVLSSGLAAKAWAGLEPPAGRPKVAGTATLVGDPASFEGAVRVELRLGGRRLEAWARGAAAGALRPRLAGERVAVAGRLAPVSGRRRAYLAHRHVGAVLQVQQVGEWSAGGPVARLANGVRRTLLRGAESVPERRRALFAGIVLGDDRDQDVGTIEDFRAAGLSHLLAVSGQNVAFVLALAGPLLRRLGLRSRLGVALAVLVGFGVLTRWEPSVLRAEAMAALALVAATLGRPASTVRVLALAVAGLLLVDPLLVGSVGFLLSCGACAGIAVLAGPLARRLPLPAAVTLAAQAGVAPVLVPLFGGVPLASLPANLLAVPAAGPLMVWGLAAGLPAGVVGGPLAAAAHVPTRILLEWLAGVARFGARLPLGQVGGRQLLYLAGLVGLAVVVARLRTASVALAVAVCVWPAPARPVWDAEVADGARLWRAGRSTVLAVDRPRPGPLLAGLRRVGVRRIDVVALRSDSPRLAASMAPVLDRHPTGLVLSPASAPAGASVTAGSLHVEVVAVRPRLDVRVQRRN